MSVVNTGNQEQMKEAIMSNIFEEINKKQKMFKTKPVNEDAIKEAEIKLGSGFMSISWTQFFSFFTNIFSQIL